MWSTELSVMQRRNRAVGPMLPFGRKHVNASFESHEIGIVCMPSNRRSAAV